jgi:hypothetical protein
MLSAFSDDDGLRTHRELLEVGSRSDLNHLVQRLWTETLLG